MYKSVSGIKSACIKYQIMNVKKQMQRNVCKKVNHFYYFMKYIVFDYCFNRALGKSFCKSRVQGVSITHAHMHWEGKSTRSQFPLVPISQACQDLIMIIRAFQLCAKSFKKLLWPSTILSITGRSALYLNFYKNSNFIFPAWYSSPQGRLS